MFPMRQHKSTSLHSVRPGCFQKQGRGEKTVMGAANEETQGRGELLTLNISGAIFEVREERLERCPNTLLGCKAKRVKYYDPQRDQYFFDRHRQAFEGILFYYQSDGRLIRPENVPEAVFIEEVKFFELPTGQDEGELNLLPDDDAAGRPREAQATWRMKLWELFEMPESSLSGRLLLVFSQLVLMLSIAGSCLRSVDSFQIPLTEHEASPPQGNASEEEPIPRGAARLVDDVWVLNDIICHGWFTLECAVRFLVAPNKKNYLKSCCNLVDMATIFTFYMILTLQYVFSNPLLWTSIVIRALQTISLVVRVAKLVQYSSYMKILSLTFATGANDLSMLMLFVIMVVLLSSSAVFYAETSENVERANFTSIPDTFWWSIITVTTIGYGDQVPATAAGKLVAGICMVLGTVIIALPLFRFASQFRARIESLGIGYSSPNATQTYN